MHGFFFGQVALTAAVPPGRHHPDKGEDSGKFKEFQESYSALVKATYDAQQAARGRASREQAARGPFAQAASDAQHAAASRQQAVPAPWAWYEPATPEQAAQMRALQEMREQAQKREQEEHTARHATTVFGCSFGPWLMPLTCDTR
jgi:hypothetical protein